METCPFCGLKAIFGVEGETEFACGTVIKGDTSQIGHACIKITAQADLLRQAVEVVRFTANGRIMINGKLVSTPIAQEAQALLPKLEKALEVKW